MQHFIQILRPINWYQTKKMVLKTEQATLKDQQKVILLKQKQDNTIT